GVYLDNPAFEGLNEKLAEIGARYGMSKTSTVVAWVLRHPAKMQLLTGTMNPERLKECAAGTEVTLTRQEWYEIFTSDGNILP
ncbi:MAG: aldo/keto reductase, partial [Clostridia bacterium]|nr:aldo/keto reductase [Clostridia bacterium]